ncbi:hypothetical protein WKH44_16275 [Pantoea agglomerans]|uniref:hypothetical protein n=1 Tax=Enterobacter agglomerans TaxID=549 RepID=UPI003C7D57C4
MNEEQKQALIEYCESRIADCAPYAKARKVAEVALAALNASPGGKLRNLLEASRELRLEFYLLTGQADAYRRELSLDVQDRPSSGSVQSVIVWDWKQAKTEIHRCKQDIDVQPKMISDEMLKQIANNDHAWCGDAAAMACEILAMRPCQHRWSELRLTESNGRYQYCTLCGKKKIAE